jgi:hypothetical protein
MSSMLARPIRGDAWHRKASRLVGDLKTAPNNGVQSNEAGVPNADPWEAAVRVMVGFQHLGDNWDGLDAKAPSLELLESAMGLAYTLREQGVEPPSRVVPGPEGSVSFEWQEPDGTYTEVEIDRPFHAEVLMMEPGQAAKHWTLPTD